MNRILNWISSLYRRHEAKREGVPFRKRAWYNLRAMLPEYAREGKTFIEIFDEKGHYITCPSVGGEVTLNCKGRLYRYVIVGFENESPNKDWLQDSDYINPIIEYLGKK